MKILIADDHDLFRDGLRLLLETELAGAEVREAAEHAEMIAALETDDSIDLVLTDLAMPGIDGNQTIAALAQRFPTVKVVVMSGREDPLEVEELLNLGIGGYIPKSSTSDVTLSALRLIEAGGIYLPPVLLQERGGSEVKASDEPAPSTDGVDDLPLTPRQQEIATQLGRGLSNAQIAYELGISEGTVRIHVSAILKALKVYNRTQVAAVIAQRRLGGLPSAGV